MNGMNAPARGQAQAHDSIALHSKSFALASRLLPRAVRDEAVVLYAYCRRADDAIDLATPDAQPRALSALRRELDAIYASKPLTDPLLQLFQQLVQRRELPRTYPEELIEGMAMDVRGTLYTDERTLLTYAYRVASTVGLMMCHVMGVRDDRALPHAAHLGIAMQLTNICRDVAEDWQRGRLYLPNNLLARYGTSGLHGSLGAPLPEAARTAVARTTAHLLRLADDYYASGDAGLGYLSPRCAFAVCAARLIYADIGRVVRAQDCDPGTGRARVNGPRKLGLALRAGVETVMGRRHAGRYDSCIAYPSSVLPLSSVLERGGP